MEALEWTLRRVPTAQLLELIDLHAHALTLREVRQILLNPFATGEVISALAQQRALLATYPVQSALARHPRTPEPVALRLLPQLFWRELVEVGLDVRIKLAVRQSADSYLIKRLPRLAVGERAAIARRAGAPILSHLRHDPNPGVIRALLENPRLTEQVLVPLAASREASPQILHLLAANPRWGRAYEVQVALSRNPQTPFQAAFRLLPCLKPADLVALLHEEALSSVVHRQVRRVLAERVLAEKSAAVLPDNPC